MYKNFQKNQHAFTLFELMVVVAIIAFISLMAIPNVMRYLAKSKRAEAYIHLGSIYTAEKIYWAEHGTYTNKLRGKDSAGWAPEGITHYSYGFPGSEGENFVIGKLGAGVDQLKKGYANKNGFLILAAADIDGDGKYDVIGINEKHEIIVLEDDLEG